jgi:hypothetical protein
LWLQVQIKGKPISCENHLKDFHENASKRSANIYLIEGNPAPQGQNIRTNVRNGDVRYGDCGMYCYGRKNKNIMCMVWYVPSEMQQVKCFEVGLCIR